MPSDIQPKSFVDKDFSIIVKNFCLFENLRKINKISELAIALHLPRFANGQAGDRTNTLLMRNLYDFLLLHTVIIHPSSMCDRKVSVKFLG
ncbi:MULTISPECIES: hypothetical protein [unclassified Microcoleus]|uniref:hypothetical protein n=1 Tax=unclassified Microcoleus TaxID=2642155 RepID=UPI002FD09B43